MSSARKVKSKKIFPVPVIVHSLSQQYFMELVSHLPVLSDFGRWSDLYAREKFSLHINWGLSTDCLTLVISAEQSLIF